MKRIELAGLMVCTLLLFAAQGASAQSGWPAGQSWGNAWDTKPGGNVSEYLIRPAADATTSKPAGLAHRARH